MGAVRADVRTHFLARLQRQLWSLTLDEVDRLAFQLTLPMLVVVEDGPGAGAEAAVVEEGDVGVQIEIGRQSPADSCLKIVHGDSILSVLQTGVTGPCVRILDVELIENGRHRNPGDSGLQVTVWRFSANDCVYLHPDFETDYTMRVL